MSVVVNMGSQPSGSGALGALKPWGDKLKAWWQSTNPTQRLRLAAAVAVIVVVLVVLANLLFSPNWQPLYTNLSAAQAGQITNQLAQMKVPYQLTQGGRTVLVPQSQVDQTRVALADQNIPSSGTVSFGNLTQFSLGETDQELDLTEQVALQDELAATISSIGAVSGAKVFLNEPAPSLFGESSNPTTASVFVTVKPYDTLSTGQVRGIMQLVAHAVPGLTVSHVSVVDQNGTLLSSAVLAASSPVTGATSSQLEAEQAVDASVEQSIQSLLAQVLGPGQAVVRVTSALDFSSQKVSQLITGKPVANQVETETSSSTGGGSTPAAGTSSNTPGYVATTTGPTTTKSSTVIQHFTVPETTTSTVTPPGSIERLSVAVAVSKHLTPTMQRALTKLVAQAAGLDPARGDRLSLVGIPFNTSAATAAARAIAQAETTTQYEHWAEELVLLVLGVILLRALWQAFGRWQRAPRPAPAPAGGDALPGEDVTQSVAGLLRQIKAEPRPSPGDVALQQVTGLVKENPDSVARLIRSWMTEEEG